VPIETERFKAVLHFGPSSLSRELVVAQYVQIGVFVIFVVFGFLGFRAVKSNEQRLIWVGMAKETAHQLGTPITALLGWLAILRERHGPRDEVVAELEKDVARLGKVSERFSQIGSRPRLAPGDLAATARSTLAYFERRLPHLGGRVDLRLEGALSRQVRFNPELMEWVLENLIKNGIDALRDGKGTISVRLEDGPGGGVTIKVSDTGAGIAPGARKRIFEPGFTTKQRGWGMGLALVRRIVQQYHGGRIQVGATGPAGTTFVITLPGEEPDRAVPHPVG
jgi:hypothetical protein